MQKLKSQKTIKDYLQDCKDVRYLVLNAYQELVQNYWVLVESKKMDNEKGIIA